MDSRKRQQTATLVVLRQERLSRLHQQLIAQVLRLVNRAPQDPQFLGDYRIHICVPMHDQAVVQHAVRAARPLPAGVKPLISSGQNFVRNQRRPEPMRCCCALDLLTGQVFENPFGVPELAR